MVDSHLLALRAVLDGVGGGEQIECKHFFGGAAAYADQRIFMTLTPVGLALKLPEDSRRRLLDAGARPLRYFAKGPIKTHYVILPDGLANDAIALAPWIRESIEFARSLPRPRTRRPK